MSLLSNEDWEQEYAKMTCNAYELCGCAHANDLHCMMCCRALAEHTEMPEREIQELQRRLLLGISIVPRYRKETHGY